MNYIDLHCDALTKREGVFHVTPQLLRAGGCGLQCFAAFVRGPQPHAQALSLCGEFDALCTGNSLRPVRTPSELSAADFSGEGAGRIAGGVAGAPAAMLTVEGGEACEGEVKKLEALYARGVRMMTLTWNFPNEIGAPNCVSEGVGRGHGWRRRRVQEKGLTPFGREITERMGELGMVVDVSHGSDRLFFDVAAWSKEKRIPFVASHSNADAVHPSPRNLTDGQIRALADCGGVMGLCFCAEFLSDDRSAEGQRTAILAHARHILRVGGEDVLAIGSDFDGIETNAYMQNAGTMPALLDEFCTIFGSAATEKLAYRNSLRVLTSVL